MLSVFVGVRFVFAFIFDLWVLATKATTKTLYWFIPACICLCVYFCMFVCKKGCTMYMRVCVYMCVCVSAFVSYVFACARLADHQVSVEVRVEMMWAFEIVVG